MGPGRGGRLRRLGPPEAPRRPPRPAARLAANPRIDFGYSNPFVCLWIAIDDDGRMYVYREIYHTRRTVKVHAAQINRLSEGERYEFTVADHDAEDRAALLENGIATIAANKAIRPGIEAVQERLKVAGDGKPRLFVLRDSLIGATSA